MYKWNVALSSAFYGVLQGLEITLRNAMHHQLTSRYGSAWYENVRVGLDDRARQRIEQVKTQLARSAGSLATPDKVVAGLSFGFWVSLLGPGGRIAESNRNANYEMTLWRPTLRGSFPHRESLTRRQAHTVLYDAVSKEPLFDKFHIVQYPAGFPAGFLNFLDIPI